MSIHLSEVLGFIANILSNVAFLPQIIKSFRRKKVDDVSIGMFAVLFSTDLCWIGYAVPIHAKNLWTSSVIEIVFFVLILVMWVKYREPKAATSVSILSKAWWSRAPETGS